MDLASLSIKRPAFITSIILAMVSVGYLSFKKLPVDLFPNITFPVVTVTVVYPGAGPQEIETLIAKVLENELSTVPGIKTLSSTSKEGVAIVVAQFNLEVDVKYAEQQIRDRISTAKRKLPTDAQEPIVRRIDPADQPIITLSVQANLPPAKLYELATEIVKPKLEQIPEVGLIEVNGGRKREIHVDLDLDKLKTHQLSASAISQRLQASGQNIPIGKVSKGDGEKVFRSLGEFRSLDDIKSTVVNFMGNDVPVTLNDVASVTDDLEDDVSFSYIDGKPALFLALYRQSGSNTIKVSDMVRANIEKINGSLGNYPGNPKLEIVRDTSKMIRANVEDVEESIILGIILTILVVFLFLGNVRSTFITGLAIPNCLLGSFILMSWAGFSINVMTLLALSLSVGLLVDDAIVVRENIFRYIEMGKSPMVAALQGTKQVTLAVIATTLCVIAVFGPIGFLKGVVGQFFKEFGLTICFIMMISLFDALTVAPMLSAYLAGDPHKKPNFLFRITLQPILVVVNFFQDIVAKIYEFFLKFSLKAPILIIVLAIAAFMGSIQLVKHVPKTFLSPQDFGEFMIGLELEQGVSLSKMKSLAEEIDIFVRKHPQVKRTSMNVGKGSGEPNVAEIFVELVGSKVRKMTTTKFKEILRSDLKAYAYAKPIVKDIDMVSGGQRPFNVNIVHDDLKETEKYANLLFEKLKVNPALVDVEISHKEGKPEAQVIVDRNKAEKLGVSTSTAGLELRTLMEGTTPAVFRENGLEYNVRVRLKASQRDLSSNFKRTYIPNINYSLIPLRQIASLNETVGPANIKRQDRGRYIQISGDIMPGGPGMNAAINDIDKLFKDEIKLPQGMTYSYVGQAESFKELIENIITAIILSIIFTYLVLASLYESFVTPFTIMLVLPLAAGGAFVALYLTGLSLDLNSMIGCILLLGIASKNSILLVDYANQKIHEGMSRRDAMYEAGVTRLRPILMTTLALIAGMMPIAIGLSEASRQRMSMGVAIIGGLISSTLLSLLVVPATYSYVDRFRVWSNKMAKRLVGAVNEDTESH